MGKWLFLPLVHINSLTRMIISIIIGLSIWFVVPILLESHIKGKNNKKALKMFCTILGVVIIGWAIINYLIYSI